MIVCTCDSCGKVTETWATLRVDLSGITSLSEHREICPECQKMVKTKALEFLDEITVTGDQSDD